MQNAAPSLGLSATLLLSVLRGNMQQVSLAEYKELLVARFDELEIPALWQARMLEMIDEDYETNDDKIETI